MSSWGSTGHFPGGGAGSSRDTLIFGREMKSFLRVYISLGKALLAIGCRAALRFLTWGVVEGREEGGEDKIVGPSDLRSNYPA